MKPLSKTLVLAVAAILALGTFDASARSKKPRAKRAPAADSTRDLTVTRGHLVDVDREGMPIIMKGYKTPAMIRDEEKSKHPPAQRAVRLVKIHRGSSTYIPPVNPSPYSSNSSPASALTQPVPAPYQPPKITTFSDRVAGAIHDFPLQGGIGNNPADQQRLIRQRANQ